ncbi:MAG TPA: malto-oligosyltrehalose trehalohydrolase [Methylomirabilota bacterium]|nr:malto-oligosyltrehalose trehalohydrolase [Methylomirabilota bacterium]
MRARLLSPPASPRPGSRGLPLDRMNGPGASIHEGGATFRVWAPRCRTVDVLLDGGPPQPLTAVGEGLFELGVKRVRAGARYQYRLDGRRYRPDPVSRWQPEGVHGPSVVVDTAAFAWTDERFRGHALADLVFYELHVGTFSTAGTFEGVIPYLDRLAELGVTAVELMPIAEFPGSRSWGYDGVHLFAPQSTYGGPRGLSRLVDACHARGLSVFLDVVYNHLGPEGNYLAEYGPYFTDRYETPWGQAVNFDGPDAAGVRRHFVENARMWVREFHVDGLRLDAIHSIFDSSPVHILIEIAAAVREEAASLGRPGHVTAESHDNDRAIVTPAEAGGIGLDAVWADDFHHALHVRLTGETTGYYVDFADGQHLPRALAEGFAYQGEPSVYFGRPRGTPSGDVEGERFVLCTQNHDQVGNRAQGDRLATIVPFEAAKLAAALLMVAPALPLLFMGEEYGETAPFQFFTSFLDPGLAAAVRRGRAAEFSRFGWTGAISDPQAPDTYVRSRLNHALAGAPRHRALREFYRAWLALRRQHPALGARGKSRTRAALDETGSVLVVDRAGPSGEAVQCVANLGAKPQIWPAPPRSRVLLDSAEARFGGPERVRPLEPWQVLLYALSG